MKRWGCLVAAFAAILVPLLCMGVVFPAEAAFFLLAGWLFFLSNTLPNVTVNGAGVATAIVALAVFVAGFHRLGTWWAAATPVLDNVPGPYGRWHWRWTLIATAMIVLSFTAGIAIVGATHQIVWMATSEEPLAHSTAIEFQRIESKNNLKQIALSLHNYENKEQHFPAGGTFNRVGQPLFGWQTELLPYVNQQAVFERINLELPWDAPENAAALATAVPTYQMYAIREPDQQMDAAGRSLSHYAANGLVLNSRPGLTVSAFKDGTSNTFFAGEAKAQYKPWGYPLNWRDARLGINRSPDGFGGPWKRGAHLLLADGSVRFVSENIDQNTLDALATPDGGETVGEF